MRDKADLLLVILLSVIALVLVGNVGLYLRMTQLQAQVVEALAPLASFAQPQPLLAGSPAPPFTLTDYNGDAVSLSDFSGRPVLLVFSSVTCQYCQKMYPVLQSFHKAHPATAVLMISQGSPEENRQLAQREGLDFPILSWDTHTADTYQVTGTPFSYGVDSTGLITGAEFATSLEELETLVGKTE